VTRRLLATYVALTAAVLASLMIPLALVQASNEQKDLTAKIERDAFVVAAISEDAVQKQRRTAGLAALVARYRTETGGRVVIVDRKGRSLADSQPTTPGERVFSTRPEVKAALRGQTVAGTRTSQTLHERLLYVAVPVSSSGKVYGAVRITYPTATLDSRVRRYREALALVALIVLAAVAAIGIVLARSIAAPLRRVGEAAGRMGSGDLGSRASETDGPPEVRQLARELNSSAAKLEVLVASQTDFVADASHELRTPLTALRLRIEAGEPEAALAEVQRLAALVDELLALARADASAAPAALVGLDNLVRGRAETWEPLADERGVRLETVAGGATVRVGERRVEQVLDNLLANALEVSTQGAAIEIRANEGSLHVVDAGPGLNEEQRARAFDRFWRAGSGRGSGLGLAIVKRLVEIDGGSVSLESAPSGGIDAWVRYPISRP
jgi:signal transduction histidine kinase